MRHSRWTHVAGFAVALFGTAAQAQDISTSIGDLQLVFTASITSGVAIRMQKRDLDLIGKLNVPGQQHLCDKDDCMSLSGDPAPNLRLVQAKGSYSGGNTDDGDLNYDKYFVEGESALSKSEDYTSHNAQRLDIEGVKALLKKLDIVNEAINA